jgi:8-oxo-dGTP pyrophosphatase MutT (NUDIX family)
MRSEHGGTTRDLVVAVFVVHANRVLLHPHAKLGIWLPPGGHVEALELPDDAATREVLEESGIAVELVGEREPHYLPEAGSPRHLVRPRGIQLEGIGPGHEHLDLVYLARPKGDPAPPLAPFRWLGSGDLPTIPLTGEIRAWCRLALTELAE